MASDWILFSSSTFLNAITESLVVPPELFLDASESLEAIQYGHVDIKEQQTYRLYRRWRSTADVIDRSQDSFEEINDLFTIVG